jgi:TRAP-type mannitol/chloroaromatic compound transport system permease large subunit
MMINGIVTPSEAAAFGALGVFILAAFYRCLTWDSIKKSVWGAAGDTDGLSDRVRVGHLQPAAGLLGCVPRADFLGDRLRAGPTLMLLVMFGVLLLLGMFMEQISIMLLTVPIFFPLATSIGFDPIWFGLVMLLSLEISFTTPPFGLLLFVMKGVAPPGTTMKEIYSAALPFILCSLLVVALLILFPPLATWLPSQG